MAGPPHRRRRRTTAPSVNHERWLVSYADFITLLFAFFTTMYAISTVDAQKMSKMVQSVQTAFASNGEAAIASSPTQASGGSTGVDEESFDASLARELSATLGGEFVEVSTDARGVVVSIKEGGSFPTGSADLSPVARDVLARIAASVRYISSGLRIEGHTDDVPIRGGRYSSNWELSTARATAVVQFLAAEGVLDPNRLSAAGYGEFRPRSPNVDDASRARNRRVDIVILNAETARAEEPQAMAGLR